MRVKGIQIIASQQQNNKNIINNQFENKRARKANKIQSEMAKQIVKKIKTIAVIRKQNKIIPSKKKIPKRQGTMVAVAEEGNDFLKYTEISHQKRLEEKRELQKKANSFFLIRKIKKTKPITKTKENTSSSSKKSVQKEMKQSNIKKTVVKNDKKAVHAAKQEIKASKEKGKKDNKKQIQISKKQKTQKDKISHLKTGGNQGKNIHKEDKFDLKKQKNKIDKKTTNLKVSTKKTPKTKTVIKNPIVNGDSSTIAPLPVEGNSSTTVPLVVVPPINASVSKKQIRAESKLIESGLAAGIIDVVFCLDTTGSMDQYLEKTKETVTKIVQQVKEQSKGESVSVRFGVVAYRDHPPQETSYLTKVKDLCQDNDILNFLHNIDCSGGGDGAEAVFDGLFEAAKNISWRDSSTLPSLRYIFHIADQPPHGAQYKGYSELWDAGCPCGIDVNKVAHIINIEQIHYRLVKIGSKLDSMADEFKEKFVNYEECRIDNAVGMDIKITDMIIRELIPDVDYNIDA